MSGWSRAVCCNHKLGPYVAAILVSSLLYTGLLTVTFWLPAGGDLTLDPSGNSLWHIALVVDPFLAAFVAGAALFLMFVPWWLVVWASRRFDLGGFGYFASAGACMTFVVGCVASALAPKPLFIEDQTFPEAILIAAERQGLILVVTGIVGGLVYWLLGERRPPDKSTPNLAGES